eukprot:gene3543-2494_t
MLAIDVFVQFVRVALLERFGVGVGRGVRCLEGLGFDVVSGCYLHVDVALGLKVFLCFVTELLTARYGRFLNKKGMFACCVFMSEAVVCNSLLSRYSCYSCFDLS